MVLHVDSATAMGSPSAQGIALEKTCQQFINQLDVMFVATGGVEHLNVKQVAFHSNECLLYQFRVPVFSGAVTDVLACAKVQQNATCIQRTPIRTRSSH